MNRNWQDNDRVAPVKVGEEIDVRIEAVGEKGDGVAKKDGFVLFVPNTRAGDEVRIRVTKVLPKVGFAEVVSQAPAGASKKSKQQEPAPEEAPEEQEPVEDSENFGEELEEEE